MLVDASLSETVSGLLLLSETPQKLHREENCANCLFPLFSSQVTYEMLEWMDLHKNDNTEAKTKFYFIGMFNNNLDNLNSALLASINSTWDSSQFLGYAIYLVMTALRMFVIACIGKYSEDDQNCYCISLEDLKRVHVWVEGMFSSDTSTLTMRQRVLLAHRVWTVVVEKWTKTTPRHLTSWLDSVTPRSRLSTLADTRAKAIEKFPMRPWEKEPMGRKCHRLSGVAYHICVIIVWDSVSRNTLYFSYELLIEVAERIHVSLSSHNKNLEDNDQIFKAEVFSDVVLFARRVLAAQNQQWTMLLTHPCLEDGIPYKPPVAPRRTGKRTMEDYAPHY